MLYVKTGGILVFLQTCNVDFDEIIMTFTDENGRELKMEDKVNLILINRKDKRIYRTKKEKTC